MVGRAPLAYGLTQDDVSNLIDTGAALTTGVVELTREIPRKSELERLYDRRAQLIAQRGRARTSAERQALDVRIQGVDAQIAQYTAAVEQAGQPLVITAKAPRSANPTAILVGVGAVVLLGVGAYVLASRL